MNERGREQVWESGWIKSRHGRKQEPRMEYAVKDTGTKSWWRQRRKGGGGVGVDKSNGERKQKARMGWIEDGLEQTDTGFKRN